MRSRKKLRILLSNAFSFLIISAFKEIVKGKDKILYVNSEKLGDLVLCSDFFVSQRQNTDYNEYYLVLQEEYKDLFNWSKAGIIPILFNKKSYKKNLYYRIKFIREIRTLGFSKAVNITPERGMVDEEIVLTSGAVNKTALKSKSLFLSKKVSERNNSLYNEIFNSVETNEYKRLISFSGGDYSALEILNYNSCEFAVGEYIVVAPMASEMDRTIGLNKYKELISGLSGQIYIIGAGDEKERIEKIIADKSNVINLAGKVTIPQASWLIKNCKLFIGNDSGLSHIALNSGVPMIAIIGGGKYNIFFPYKERNDALYLFNKMNCFGCSWFCIHKEMECLTKISINEIFNAAEKLVKKSLV